MNYALNSKEKLAVASTTLDASPKTAKVICKQINRKSFAEAKIFMNKLVEHDVSIDGKFHNTAAEGILRLLGGLETNARHKKTLHEGAKLMISAHMGPKMMRGRRKRRFGMLMKNASVQAILMPGKPKEAIKEKKQ